MKKLDFAQSVGLLANLGVIAGIVFLGLELQQNNEILEEQRRFNRLSTVLQSHATVAENPAVAVLLAKLDEEPNPLNPTSLSAAERRQALSFGMRVLTNQEWQFRTLPRAELPVASMRRVSKEAFWRYIWNERKDEFDSDFAVWVEENVVGH